MTLAQANPTLRLKAPTNSGECLVAPAVDRLNAVQLAGDWCQDILYVTQFCGKTLADLRREARSEAIELAENYVANYRAGRVLPAPNVHTPLIVAGHQPELFHPGVWFKNFLLDQVAKKLGGIALNLVIDNDLCRSVAIKVPGHDGDQVTFESVPWDVPRQAIPWEMRHIDSLSTFASFPDRVRQHLNSQIADPLVGELWTRALDRVNSPLPAGEILAQARHSLELDFGLTTLELPLSKLTGTRSFARFSLRIMREMVTFREIYNWHRGSYRKTNRIRNDAHPVPALQERAGWSEGPWWIYRGDAPKRQRLFISPRGEDLLLSDQHGWQAMIDGPIDSEDAVDQWMELLSDDIFLRPRALLTTMYVRMCLGDLFIHGIGGGKYDELTNAILTDFFGCLAPPYVVATATMHLPIDMPTVTQQQIRDLQAYVVQLRHHPDRFVDANSETAASLLERHRVLLANVPEKGKKWKWHQELTEVHGALEGLLTAKMESSQRQLDKLMADLRIRQSLESREFSYCVFPTDLMIQLRSLAQNAVGSDGQADRIGHRPSPK